MQRQARNWIIFTIGCYLLMFMIVPPKKGPRLSPFGFYFGFLHAVILNWLAVKTYKLWKLPGDILINGIPVLTCISWLPPAVLFAYFFPYDKKAIWKVAYIFFYSIGTTIVQYIQGLIGMWESKNWKPIYTLPLSFLTHSIMALGLPIFRLKNIRES